MNTGPLGYEAGLPLTRQRVSAILFLLLLLLIINVVVRDSSFGIATHYGLDGPGIEFLWEARFFAPVQTGPGAYPASYTMGTGSFPGVKWQGRGVDLPPHLTPKLKKE
jgi:hypothetical protein